MIPQEVAETPAETPAESPPADTVGVSRSARGLTGATALTLLLRVIGIGIGMATTAVLARFLEPAGYGMFSLALTLGTAAAQVADMGIAITVAARIAKEKGSAGRVLSTGLAIRTTAAVVATVGLLVAALAGVFGDSSTVVGIVAIATPLSAASVLSAGSIARFRPEMASVLALLQGALWLVAVFAVARAQGDVRALAWFYVAVVAIQTCVGVAMNRKIVPLGKPSLSEAGRLLSISWPLAVSALAVMVYYRLNSLVLFNAKGASEVGYYSAAYKFIDVAQLGPGLLVASLIPIAASSMVAEIGRRKAIFSFVMRIGITVGAGTALMLVVLANPLVETLYGPGYEPAVRPLILLAVAFVGITLGWIGTTICSSLGMVRPIAVVTVSVAVLSLGAQLWACQRWGATGAAAVMLGTEWVAGTIACLLAARAMTSRLPWRELAIALAAGCAAVVLTIVLALPWLAEAVLAGALFAAALVVFRVITKVDITRVLSKKLL